jgi:outer membrane protein assembly factor BamD (BamD/ComL family)
MKNLLLIATFFVGKILLAQAPNYDNLKILYADEDFEKLVSKCERYMRKDKTKKDPIPYMWGAKGLYKISVSGNDDPEYKNAFKEAMGVMSKSIKYDTDGACRAEHADFYNEFLLSSVELIVNEAGTGDFRKAYSWNLKYSKITDQMGGTKYMEAACKFMKSDKGGANSAWKEAEAALEGVESINDWMDADKKMLMYGVIYTADCYLKSRQNDKAKALMDRFAPWFSDYEVFKSKQKEI